MWARLVSQIPQRIKSISLEYLSSVVMTHQDCSIKKYHKGSVALLSHFAKCKNRKCKNEKCEKTSTSITQNA